MGGAQAGHGRVLEGRGAPGWAGRAGVGGACGTLTGDLEEADSRAHVVGDAALVAAAAVAGDGVEAQLGVIGGLAGDGGGGRRGQQLPFEAPHGRGDALGAASEERAAQEHGPAQGLAHILGAGLHLRRDWGRRRGAVSVAEVGLRGGPWARRGTRPCSRAPSLEGSRADPRSSHAYAISTLTSPRPADAHALLAVPSSHASRMRSCACLTWPLIPMQ